MMANYPDWLGLSGKFVEKSAKLTFKLQVIGSSTAECYVFWNFKSDVVENLAAGTYCKCGPGKSVCIATDYGLDGPGSNAGEDEIFRPSRPVLGLTQPPVKWVSVLSRPRHV